MTCYDKILKIAQANNGIITTSQIEKNNLPRWYLSDMVRKEQIIRVARGIYTLPNGDYDNYYFFQLKNTKCIYSYTNALYFHGLTDRIPFQKEVTVYKGYNSSHFKDDTIVHYVKRNLYNIGISEKDTNFGNNVKVYDMERTICDLVKSRKDIDVEIFSKAVKQYATHKNRDYKKLKEYAKLFSIVESINDLLELL